MARALVGQPICRCCRKRSVSRLALSSAPDDPELFLGLVSLAWRT
jgi:hypothetical protein